MNALFLKARLEDPRRRFAASVSRLGCLVDDSRRMATFCVLHMYPLPSSDLTDHITQHLPSLPTHGNDR